MLQRGVMTLLLLVLSVTAMWADQAIVVDITGGHNTWSLQIDGEAVTSFNASGEATVSGKNGKTAVLTLTPETGYTVTNFIIYTTYDFLSPSPTRINPGATQINYKKSDDTYTFTMPADEANGVYIKATIINSTSTNITSLSQITATDGTYIITSDISGGSPGVQTFSGTLEAAIDPETHMPYRISGLSTPLFETLTGTVKNLVLEGVNISGNNGNTGAIAGTANSAARIYNVGILSGSVGGTENTGGIVGFLDGTARVINCYSYANITGGTNVAGIVGNNNYASKMNDVRTMVVNCMFYGEITGNTIKPVYGGKSISNKGTTGINNYNYFRGSAAFNTETTFSSSDAYYCSWPASEEYLTRFEYYRSILNSNRRLCTWWVNGTSGTTPTDEDVNNVGIAKWVLDPNIAPYPILKKWGKYPSVINQDKEYTFNPDTKQKVSRASAPAYQGKELGTLSVTVNAGSGHQGSGSTSKGIDCIVLDMDTLNYDYGYAKIQLPYYNEVFGNPEAADHATRYAGNYTDKAVTGWKVTDVSGGTSGTFKKAWEDGYNFADRKCTSKDLYDTSGRVFAQGGYYYVPEGVTSITIEAYWANKVIYLHNNEHSLDRVNVASGGTTAGAGTSFSPAGTLPTSFQGQTVYTTLQNAIAQLTASASLTVYDQAIVLVGNVQLKNLSASVGHTGGAANNKPFTIMSIDQDLDNEPDYCLELQFRNGTDRPTIHPIRFDFLPIPELGLAIKTDSKAYAIGIMVPLGHFEITETAFMHTTQFEYDGANRNAEGPMILNGGQFEQIVIRYGSKNHTNYFLMGGNFRMSRFTPGYHATPDNKGVVRHCAVNAIGGDFPEFYLSGIYRPDLGVNADNPHCYINGGRFGTVAGAGYEQVNGNVTFQIDHAIIDEFYGGGMNSAKPVTGSIDVTINNSIVYDKYCGGPMVGEMTKTEGVRKTVTTNATNTIFGQYFGGGNGGTSYYREQSYDSDIAWPSSWTSGTFKFDVFNPLNTASINKKYDAAKGYHDMFEYEVFNQSNGVNDNVVARTFTRWAQFGTTITGKVTNNLTGCTINRNFYGGGNMGNVDGDVTSTLTNTEVKGNAFGAGFSASIPQFRRHDRDKVHIPARNKSGQIVEQGYLEYYQDGGKDVYYRWTNDNNNGTATKDAPTYYSDVDKEWKCYTPVSLEGLGAVSGIVTLNIEGTTTVAGSVYGGGEESNVKGNTQVNINGGTIAQNVFGGGKGKDDNFRCDKAMVGVNDEGACENPASETNKNKGTKVSISNGTVNGNVYGGGEVGRVEWNTQVIIGVGDGTPEIMGSVFGAGAGKETHGYSALVRGNSSVTVQGKAKVKQNVYGGGEKATVGRYWVKGIPADPCPGEKKPEEPDVPNEMPYQTRSGGKCTVTIQGEAQIGAYEAADKYKGHVFGAGKGVEPNYVYGTDNKAGWSRRMVDYNPAKHTGDPGTTWDYYPDNHNYVWEYFATEAKYLEFLQSLALVTSADVTINGSTSVTSVKGNVYGGSESGFVQDDAKVEIQAGIIGAEGTTTYGNVFGGGRGLSAFAEAGKVKGNTKVVVSGGTTNGSVYGGGELGDVGTINKANINSYRWTDLTIEPYTYNNTGVCTVSVTGASAEIKGHVFGAGKGEAETFECEKAMVYDTNVNISKGTVNGNVYGGGQIGRVENNTGVMIGVENETKSDTPAPLIKGSVFGAGAGVETHGYAALMRGNSAVTIQGNANVRQSVYGGGEIASVGRYWVKTLPKLDGAPDPPEGLPLGMPYETRSGGDCTVIVRDNAIIGSDGTDDAGNVFGAGKGVDPHFDPGNSKRMFKDSEGNNVWDTFASEAQYLSFLETLALATKPDVTIAENAIVKGSVFGGGQIGITKGSVKVNITGGTVSKDVYGGGALANTIADNWNVYQNTWTASKYDSETHATSYTTEVALTGGTVNGNVYGGGLGRKAVEGKAAIGEAGQDGYVPAVEAVKGIEAKVYGDVLVELNGTPTTETIEGQTVTSYKDNCVVKGDIFGCNNLNGSPQNAVTVHVYKTVGYDDAHKKSANRDGSTYDLTAVYGGGNQAAFEPYCSRKNATAEEKALSYAKVIIDGCGLTSIKQVYGGGNAAATPGTNVIVNSAYEIDEVFGGGNGLDDVLENGKYFKNPGANVGYGNYSELDGTGAGTQISPYNCKDKDDASTKELRRTNYMYGSGAASVNIYGGRIHRVFGGSNTKGNVCETAVTILDNEDPCSLVIDEAYGGGKSAPMDAEAKLLMACLPGLNEVYGGAQDADVMGDVTLNITNGTFDRVFGGNNISGTIHGKITVNIEETGCQPLIIGELYGGGNKAPYSVYGYNDDRTPKTSGDKVYPDPVVNVKSFTSIGNIYGGGYGETAVMYGDPTVNVNVVEGEWKDKVANESDTDYNTPGYMYDATGYKGTTKEIGGENVVIPPHGKGKIGVINNVFGGGNAAPVEGSTHVNIGTTNSETYVTGDNASHEVKGVDIRGNVYGGGNKADVTGSTNVRIGKENSTPSPARETTGGEVTN